MLGSVSAVVMKKRSGDRMASSVHSSSVGFFNSNVSKVFKGLEGEHHV